MPKKGQKPATTTTSKAPSALAEAAAKKAAGLPVMHPEVKTFRCFGPDALTMAKAKVIIGWETKADYQARVAREDGVTDPKLIAKIEPKEAEVAFRHKLTGPVILRRNAGNRELTLSWAEGIGQDILARHWAGPTTLADEVEFVYGGEQPYKMADGRELTKGCTFKLPRGTVNGETIVVSRTGHVKSAQHRLVGYILACLEWHASPERFPQWPAEPVLETLIVYGVSDDEAVTTTMDNTLARTEADSFLTTGAVNRVLGDKGDRLDRKERMLICRMLQAAVDFVWMRVGKGQYQYPTHSATRTFLNDHPRLYKAVKHIWEENANRQLSLARLSPGQCAGAMYLMAAGKSDKTKWDAQTGTERLLDLGLWPQAEKFWTDVASKTGHLRAVTDEIGALLDDPESPSRGVGKLAIVAKAWAVVAAGKALKTAKQGEVLTSPDLQLEYAEDDEGRKVLVNAPGFGGIDLGPVLRKIEEEEETTEQQAEERKKALRAENAKRLAEARKADTVKAPGEVAKPEPVKHDANGKPPAPALKKPAVAAKK